MTDEELGLAWHKIKEQRDFIPSAAGERLVTEWPAFADLFSDAHMVNSFRRCVLPEVSYKEALGQPLERLLRTRPEGAEDETSSAVSVLSALQEFRVVPTNLSFTRRERMGSKSPFDHTRHIGGVIYFRADHLRDGCVVYHEFAHALQWVLHGAPKYDDYEFRSPSSRQEDILVLEDEAIGLLPSEVSRETYACTMETALRHLDGAHDDSLAFQLYSEYSYTPKFYRASSNLEGLNNAIELGKAWLYHAYACVRFAAEHSTRPGVPHGT